MFDEYYCNQCKAKALPGRNLWEHRLEVFEDNKKTGTESKRRRQKLMDIAFKKSVRRNLLTKQNNNNNRKKEASVGRNLWTTSIKSTRTYVCSTEATKKKKTCSKSIDRQKLMDDIDRLKVCVRRKKQQNTQTSYKAVHWLMTSWALHVFHHFFSK